MTKKILLLSLILSVVFQSVIAQYQNNNYNDPHNPVVCGIASYFLPGLGQIIAGETKRGLMFTGAYLGGTALAVTGFLSNSLNPGTNGIILIASGLTISFGSSLWSIIDAVIIANKKNNDYRKKLKDALSIKIYPTYNYLCNATELIFKIEF